MEKPKFELFTGAILSMAHISQTDEEQLNTDAIRRGKGLIVDEFDYGYWLYIMDEKQDALKDYSPEFQALYALGQAEGWTNIKLDRDGPVVEGLPVFEW